MYPFCRCFRYLLTETRTYSILNQMNSKLKPSHYSMPDAFVNTYPCSVVIFLISFSIIMLHDELLKCHESTPRQGIFYILSNNSSPQCIFGYGECLCSASQNRSEKKIPCITNMSAFGAKILPPISMVLQLYVLYELFVKLRDRRFIVAGIVWLTLLFVLIVISFRVFAIVCLSFVVDEIISFSGAMISGIIFVLFAIERNREERSKGYSRTYRRRESASKEKNREILCVVVF